MSVAEQGLAWEYDGDEGGQTRLTVAPDAVEVRRNAGLAAGVGALASAVAIAYLARAVQSGGLVDWLLVATMGVVGIGWLAASLDARIPLLIADSQGVRLRLGRTWRGLPWSAVQRVEHTPRRGWLHDGRLAIVPRNRDKLLGELDPAGRRRARITTWVHGQPFAVPLGLSTRVVGGGDDVQAALERVAAQAAEVVLVRPAEVGDDKAVDHSVDGAEVVSQDDRPVAESPAVATPADEGDDPAYESSSGAESEDPAYDGSSGVESEDPAYESSSGAEGDEAIYDGPARIETTESADEVDTGEIEVVASPTPSPLRAAGPARRFEVRHDLPTIEDRHAADGPAVRELRRPGSINLVEEAHTWGDRVRPIARQGEPVEPLVLDEFAVEPAEDPVVGPELSAARTRLGLSVDQLAERTRIRPHVIESIEVDDFVPCGGDFYARGHLRTLARVLGVAAEPLLVSYDERYAHAPINPRRVFEAELATGASGSIRSTRGGSNWTALAAAVMALVLAWSIARLVMDSPPELADPPVLNGSGGPAQPAPPADPVPVTLTAVESGAHVVVRDAQGEVVFKGNLAAEQSQELEISPPVRVQSTDGGVTVGLNGAAGAPVGEPGAAGQRTFVP